MLFVAIIERVRIWRRERETIAALRGLTERNLADIGIVPGNVQDVAREAARA